MITENLTIEAVAANWDFIVTVSYLIAGLTFWGLWRRRYI